MRRVALASLVLVLLVALGDPAHAIYRITRDYGGRVDHYKARYLKLRESGDRIVIDGICNSACTLVLGIVPRNRICVTPRASLGFHEAYVDKRWTGGLHIASAAGTAELMALYPREVKSWIARQGGLTPQMKRIKNGAELWAILDPCPEEF